MRQRIEELPEGDVLRNSPLSEINAAYRLAGTKKWREVLPTYGIALNHFNQLGPTWLSGVESCVA